MTGTVRWTLIALIAAHLALTVAFSIYNPLGEAPDEADHWAYVYYVQQERRLPTTPRMTQGKHPPLYHGTAAAVASLADPSNDFLRHNPDVEIQPAADWAPNFFIHTTREGWPWWGGVQAMHLARLWSAAISTAVLLAALGLVRCAFPGRTDLLLLSAGILAFLPEFAFVGAAVSNDGAAALFGTLALWGALAIYRQEGRWLAGWWTPLALGAGLLAKVSTVALWPVVGLAIVLGAARPGQAPWLARVARAWPRWLATGLAVFLPALAIASPWLIRNGLLYGDPLGMALVRQTVDLRSGPWTWVETAWLLRGWFVSFWGRFGGAGHVPFPDWVYWLLLALTGISAAGLVRRWLDPAARPERGPTVLLALAALATAFGVWRYSLVALGTDQGRLLYPALVPLVTLWALGLLAWAPPEKNRVPGILLTAGMAGLALLALFGVIGRAFAPPPPLPDREIAHARAPAPVDFGELALLGWTLAAEPVLYWQAVAPPSQDWRTTLRVTREDGAVAWEWKRSPGKGRWSTDHWPEGTVVRDAYTVRWPDWAGPGRYLVEVALQPYAAAPVSPAGYEEPFVILGWLTKP